MELNMIYFFLIPWHHLYLSRLPPTCSDCSKKLTQKSEMLRRKNAAEEDPNNQLEQKVQR